jgi:hypothetical protein
MGWRTLVVGVLTDENANPDDRSHQIFIRVYHRASMTEEIECPFCGEPGEIAADYDPDAVGDQVFVQDCAVCCRPWTVTVHVGADGEVSFDVQRS